jgi:hypothetical protein
VAENWHKRHAVTLASQLPENATEANAVIRELESLIDWLYPAEVAAPSKVVSLVRDQA